MRCSVEDLRGFYGSPAGAVARRLIGGRLDEAWGEAVGCDVLGLGYASPFLDGFVGARRVIAAMPFTQGVEIWPGVGKNRAVLVEEERLPFAAGAFDRIVLAHMLEEAADPSRVLAEAVRALAPAGRIILVAASRGGMWSRSEATPFGFGRPFTLRQLERLAREAGLEPTARAHTLFVPPWRPLLGLADGMERLGRNFAPGFAGVILLEATRQAYAVIPRGQTQRASAPGILQPQPATPRVPLARTGELT